MDDLENGRVSYFTLEKRYLRKDGTVIDGKIIISAVRNESGKPNLFVAELEDITERKSLETKVRNYSRHLERTVELRTAQLKDANEQLIKAERFATIGELAGMVGHDLRNPLAAIKNATYYLKKKEPAFSEAHTKEMLEILERATNHSDKIINDLLEYSKEMHLDLAEDSIPKLVNLAVDMIDVPDRIEIVYHIHEEPLIWVDGEKIVRVLTNLIKNSIDAMPNKGKLEINTCETADCIEIEIADTGVGIPDDILQKLFSPLITTKAQGMGFGLAICKRIVEAHGGTIRVKTELNKGTTFKLILPLKPKTDFEREKTLLIPADRIVV
jgi:signal transduction histidine kinase